MSSAAVIGATITISPGADLPVAAPRDFMAVVMDSGEDIIDENS
jgi:hypothetical protein